MIISFILSLLVLPMVLADFIKYLFTSKHLFKNWLYTPLEVVAIIINPIVFLINDFSTPSNCCADETQVFASEHSRSITILILLCMISYFYSRNKKEISSPILEILLNIFIGFGVILNIFMIFHFNHSAFVAYSVFGLIPIALLFLMKLAENHKQLWGNIQEIKIQNKNALERFCYRILNLPLFAKIPLLTLLALPLLLTLVLLLMLFGQKPDSMILAFTETYKHGFSQLDYLCENVQCGGHYLCSVAANGHKKVVKPIRYGIRSGGRIICNRQLLVSNAFEELIEEKFPMAHRIIRKNYNKVGDVVHKYYGIFSNKYISDIVYFMMKPLELFFVITLYTFDKKPENRIARQYANYIKIKQE